ncbi:MAG: DUF1294 domain-containing protein [Planctomycetota bacterium]
MSPTTLTLGILAVLTAALSLVSIVVYWVDKRAAANGRRRIPEARLLGIDAIGGWPGGAIARRLLRHKTHKLTYRVKWYLAAGAHLAVCAGLVWVVTR